MSPDRPDAVRRREQSRLRSRTGRAGRSHPFFQAAPNTRPVLTRMWPDSGGNDTVGLDNPIHIAFLLILLLLVFGAKRLPEMGQSLGAGMRGFKDSLSGEGTQASLTAQQQPATTAASTATAAPAPVTESAVAPVSEPVAEQVIVPVEEPRAP